MGERIPLTIEPIEGTDAVKQYDRGARYYMTPEYKYQVRRILRRGIRRGRVLDIGTGSGRLAIELARARNCNFEIIALDISPDMLEKARQNARRYGVEDRIKFVVGTAAALPFPDDSFDLVISYASLHHWFEPVDVFNEIARVTRPDGCAIVRDNRRVSEYPVWRFAVWLVSRFMNKRHRDKWPGVIQASYTVPELRELVGRSNLQNWRTGTDFLFIDLYVETPPANNRS
jgi:ubiquinone/menaquinone biosynthesis C-methylase UbiE